ncbi:MAG: glycosyltransferase family 4 protein [Acidobacteria bacterium]|nr:glycosyltransferase family 4 protein [Acidobacteriota bacterium]
MNVLLLTINYAPEPTGFAPHTTALCEHLVTQGHAVTVLTGFPFAPYWKRWPEYRRRWAAQECANGITLIRLTHFIPRRPGRLLDRLLMEGSFALAAGFLALFRLRTRPDVILYVGAQPSIAMLATLLASMWRVPCVVKITDLAAQAAADVGIVKMPWLTGALKAFEYRAYSQADGAIVLCSSFRQSLLADHYPADQIRVICDSVDLNEIGPGADGRGFRREHQLKDGDFVVLYSGSMGAKQGLANVIEAATLFNGCDATKWVIVGEGELKAQLEKLVREYKLSEKVRLLPLQPREKMSAMFSAADILLLNQLTSVKDTVIPSKLLTYMAAGKPVLAAVNASSQAGALLRESGGGMIVKPEDPSALAHAVNELQKDRALLDTWGRRNRLYAETHFDRQKIVAAQENFLLDILKKAGKSSRSARPVDSPETLH